MQISIDWPSFLGRHDLVWEHMPQRWLDAPFLGNGMLGTMVRQTGDRTVRWDVGRGDVQDHRLPGGRVRRRGEMLDTCRLPIGFFDLKTVGEITGGTMRLDLWNAEATGVIKTGKGSIGWRSIVHAERTAILVEIDPSGGESACRWEWNALPAVSPRWTRNRTPDDYEVNPPPTQSREGEVCFCTQPLLAGGETVTAWHIGSREQGMSVLTVGVAHSFPGNTAASEAVHAVNSAVETPMAELVETHRAWWHAYYPQSFVSLPDTEWESFYWIQMYKLASATRADGMLIDNQGPWLQPTAWPGAWWDLNVQLTYWPTYASNRLELGESLCRALYDNAQNLVENVPPEYRHDSAAIGCTTGQACICPVLPPDGERKVMMGLLLWGLHNCWLHYRCTMDDAALRENLFPLLRRAVNYYFHFITDDKDGVMHLPPTWSPEFKTRPGLEVAIGPDCNFDLSLFRWGCRTLIEACERLSMKDPMLPRWKETLSKLAEYPRDENGFMIGAGIPFNTKHRHYSHLLMLYPLYLVNADQEGAEGVAMKSLEHWQSFGASHGYALTGASSMASAFGRGNEALASLEQLTKYVSPTTMYAELEVLPVIETPLSGAQAIHDMIIQSWGGTIRVFPAAPDAWGDIVAHDLRTEGAFLVSARRKEGRTEFVRVKSLAGEPCRIMPGLDGDVRVSGAREFGLREVKPGVFDLDIRKGEEAVLWSGDTMPDTLLAPLAGESDQCNAFGLK